MFQARIFPVNDTVEIGLTTTDDTAGLLLSIEDENGDRYAVAILTVMEARGLATMLDALTEHIEQQQVEEAQES